MDFERIAACRRINVIGTSGSGKSTVSRELGEILGLPVHEIDALFWKPNWQPSTDDELTASIETVVQGDDWILDGNYTRTTPIKWRRVELVVWIDLSFPRTIAQVTRRTIGRCWSGRELWAGTGNRETFRTSFLSRESVIWWAITTHARRRREYSELCHPSRDDSSHYPGVEFIRLRSRASVSDFLRAVRVARSA